MKLLITIDRIQMTNIKYLIFLILVMLSLSHCSGLYESKKQNKSDEFLVEKKSPLVLPPNFGELPSPKFEKNSIITDQEDIKKLINKSEGPKNLLNKTESNETFENSIIEKIKKN